MKLKKRRTLKTQKSSFKVTEKLSTFSSSTSSCRAIKKSNMSLSVHFETEQNLLTFSDDCIEKLRQFAY